MASRVSIYTAICVLISVVFSNNAYAETCPDGAAMRQWRQQYQSLFNVADAYRRAGIGIKYIPALGRLNQFAATGSAVILEQEIGNFPLFRKATCLVHAMKLVSGQELSYQPYTDGKFDLLVNGKKIRDRISADELLSIAKSLRQ
jgi:hypothetical protein